MPLGQSNVRKRLTSLRSAGARAILSTTYINIIVLLCTTATGIILARSLGESGRGDYAAIIAWSGVALTVSEIGQSSALTYAVARDSGSIRANVRKARLITMIGAIPVWIIACAMAPALASNDSSTTMAFWLAFACIPLNGLFGPYLFSFQGYNLWVWNLLRTIQPIGVLGATLLFALSGNLSVLSAAGTLLGASAASLLVAALAFSRQHRYDSRMGGDGRQLLGFGVKQAGSAIPRVLGQNVDRLYLSQVVSSADLGIYAVAQSVLSVATPLVGAIASVAFPRFAAQPDTLSRAQHESLTVWRTLVLASVGAGALAVVSPWLIPLVFGPSFVGSVALVVWIAPAIVAQGVLTVMDALVRGRGRPGAASLANLLALVIASGGTAIAVSRMGVAGAGLGSTAGGLVGIVGMGIALRYSQNGREVR